MICITLLCTSLIASQSAILPQGPTGDRPTIKTVALLPWSMAAGTDGARDTAEKAIELVFAKADYQALPLIGTKKVWEEDLQEPTIDLAPEEEGDLKPLPSPKELLKLGQTLHADLVCAGRCKWHTKSVWVSLGPKTKADCTVDILIIDVKKSEVVLDAENVKADDTKTESTLETAGALFVSLGVTALSGGPKDPHQRKAGAAAVLLAFDPWLKTVAVQSRKIGN